jgi:hypothetical protein
MGMGTRPSINRRRGTADHPDEFNGGRMAYNFPINRVDEEI